MSYKAEWGSVSVHIPRRIVTRRQFKLTHGLAGIGEIIKELRVDWDL